MLTGSKFRYPASVADQIDVELREIAEIVEPSIRLSVILLALGRYEGIPVRRPQEFLSDSR